MHSQHGYPQRQSQNRKLIIPWHDPAPLPLLQPCAAVTLTPKANV